MTDGVFPRISTARGGVQFGAGSALTHALADARAASAKQKAEKAEQAVDEWMKTVRFADLVDYARWHLLEAYAREAWPFGHDDDD